MELFKSVLTKVFIKAFLKLLFSILFATIFSWLIPYHPMESRFDPVYWIFIAFGVALHLLIIFCFLVNLSKLSKLLMMKSC
jgi:hypothetical protein